MSQWLPVTNEWLNLLGFVGIALGAPALSTLYLVGFVEISRRVSVAHFWLLAGRNSLSVYLLQGILAGFVFGGYGLGLFGSLSPVALLPLSLVIALMSMALVGLWTKRFGQGPAEPILRWICRLGR